VKCFIRTDSSIDIGTGHVMRCLTLADKLRAGGGSVAFICRELPGNICDMIEGKGYEMHRLPYKEATAPDPDRPEHERWLAVDMKTDIDESRTIVAALSTHPDWLIVDHYGLDRAWEQELRPHVEKIMVIDDLANRSHDCDLLLDQNLYTGMESRYDGLVPSGCKRLCGPQYSLLREEFTTIDRTRLVRTGKIKRILVFFGGVDPSDETTRAIKAIDTIDLDSLQVDIVVGKANPRQEQIRYLCEADPRLDYLRNVTNMAELMARADLAIGAGGTTTWERCYMGLPTIAVSVADNQCEAMEVAATHGAVWYLGWHRDVMAEDIEAQLRWALENPDAVRTMSQAALQVMEGSDQSEEHAVVMAMKVKISTVS